MPSDDDQLLTPTLNLNDRIAPATDSKFRIDGSTPVQGRVQPETPEELAEILRASHADKLALGVFGGGSQMGIGNPPERYDVAVDLTGLNQILKYEPDDMTMSVAAGVTLKSINEELQKHRQVIPVDAADSARATIGGLTAAGLSGPRRFGYGSLRDLIIGISVVYADGVQGKAGGMVVKNVTGFDMMRLHHGALGSLGVIASVNLKVIPRPPSERTVVARCSSMRDAASAAMAVRTSQLGATALVVLNSRPQSRLELDSQDSWSVFVRAESPPESVGSQSERLQQVMAAFADSIGVFDQSDQSEALWDGIAKVLGTAKDSEVQIRCGVATSQMATILEQLDLTKIGVTADYGSGLLYFSLSAGDPEIVSSIWQQLGKITQHRTVVSAPLSIKHAVGDVFGDVPHGFPVMQSLKNRFDPDRILNPGRFIGYL